MAFRIILYTEDDGSIPALEWLYQLDSKVRDKVAVKIRRLKAMGYELRRPVADYLRDGIYELRISHMRVQYRILYFFNGTSVIVLSHGLKKTQIVPPIDIEKALERKKKFELNPEKHSSEVPI